MRIMMKLSIFSLVLLLSAAGCGCGGGSDTTPGAGTAEPSAPPAAGSAPMFAPLAASGDAVNYQFVDLHGKPGTLADFQGKVVIVDIWATWCGPCKMEIPFFIELYNQYKDQGFEMIGLSVDDSYDVLAPFAQQFNMNYTLHWGDMRDVERVFGPIPGFPTTFILDRNGKIVNKWIGVHEKAVFEEAIKALL